MFFLMIVLTVLNLIMAVFLILLLFRRTAYDFTKIETNIVNILATQERNERIIRDEMKANREEMSLAARQDREEISKQFKGFNDSVLQQLSSLINISEQKLENMRQTIEKRLKLLQDENSLKLEEMRQTVDEKLHAALEKRLGESFKLVSERLEQVYRGLGEMHELAAGVGDLKKVLVNVKTRGTWGEIQLGNLLEEVFTKEQYLINAVTKKGSQERVEFAIKLPGRDDNAQGVLLPIDAKFPIEVYQRLLEAQDAADTAALKELGQSLENNIKIEAKKIREKYLNPPFTTDFGIMFLPIEGLYAEVLRRPGICELLQREYRVIPTGPTTIMALLNSLQMGFRTLAVEKRASEVWQILGAVKTGFSKFGDILDKTHAKLKEVSNTIEDARTKSRTIERKLRHVQEMPVSETAELIE